MGQQLILIAAKSDDDRVCINKCISDFGLYLKNVAETEIYKETMAGIVQDDCIKKNLKNELDKQYNICINDMEDLNARCQKYGILPAVPIPDTRRSASTYIMHIMQEYIVKGIYPDD